MSWNNCVKSNILHIFFTLLSKDTVLIIIILLLSRVWQLFQSICPIFIPAHLVLKIPLQPGESLDAEWAKLAKSINCKCRAFRNGWYKQRRRRVPQSEFVDGYFTLIFNKTVIQALQECWYYFVYFYEN